MISVRSHSPTAQLLTLTESDRQSGPFCQQQSNMYIHFLMNYEQTWTDLQYYHRILLLNCLSFDTK